MAFLASRDYALLNGVITVSTVGTAEEQLEKIVTSLLEGNYGAYSSEHCTFVGIPCSLPEQMEIQIQKAGDTIPANGLLILTYLIENEGEHNKA